MFWAILKKITFEVKNIDCYFWATFGEKIGLPFVFKSGRTGRTYGNFLHNWSPKSSNQGNTN